MSFSSLLAASQTQTTFQVIPVLVLLPAFGAIAVALTPNARIGVHKMLATIFTGITGAISVWLLTALKQMENSNSFLSKHGSKASESNGSQGLTEFPSS